MTVRWHPASSPRLNLSAALVACGECGAAVVEDAEGAHRAQHEAHHDRIDAAVRLADRARALAGIVAGELKGPA